MSANKIDSKKIEAKLKLENKMKKDIQELHVRMPKHIVKQFKDYCKKTDFSQPQVLEEIITLYLQGLKEDDEPKNN